MTPELLKKARMAKSAAEIMDLAKEVGMSIDLEEANGFLKQLHTEGEMADDELDNVSGGACGMNQKIMGMTNASVGTGEGPCCPACGNSLKFGMKNADEKGNYDVVYCFNCNIKYKYYSDSNGLIRM